MFVKLYEKVKKSKGGFTLIELIVVIAILGILAVVLVPTVSGKIKDAKVNAGKSDAQAVYTVAQLYATQYEVDHGTTLPAGKYTSAEVPTGAPTIADIEKSSAFSSLFDQSGTTPKGNNGLVISEINIDSNGTVAYIKMSDKNTSPSEIKYPAAE